jgi:hypothetical protein
MGDLAMPPVEGVSTKREKSADDKYLEASAASIAAKYALDLYWERVNEQYPNYGFLAHAGYVQSSHLEAINKFGLIPGIHRLSYKPCREKAAVGAAAQSSNTQGDYSTMVATFSGLDDYSNLPSNESAESKSEKARLIRDQILAVDSEADYAELRSNPNLTREQLNWVRENLLSKEERKALAQRIRANPLPKPVTVGDVVCDRSGQIVGTVTKTMVTFLEIGDTKLSWEDFETQGLTKQEISSSPNEAEGNLQTESVPVEIAGTSDTDEVDRIVEEIRDLDRSYGLEIARRLLRLQQIWKPSLESPSFGDFCTARLGKRYGKSYRNELIAAAKVVEERLPTGVSGRLTGVDQATTISKVLNAGASPEQAIELIEDVLETGSLSADKLKAVAQERGLLPKKQTPPIVAAAQSVGLSGKETQQLPGVPPNADIPPESIAPSLTACLSLLEVNDFIRAKRSEAIAEFVSVGWQERFALRVLTQNTIDSVLMVDATESQVRQVIPLLDRDKDAKIAWLENRVKELEAKLQRAEQVYHQQEVAA